MTPLRTFLTDPTPLYKYRKMIEHTNDVNSYKIYS